MDVGRDGLCPMLSWIGHKPSMGLYKARANNKKFYGHSRNNFLRLAKK